MMTTRTLLSLLLAMFLISSPAWAQQVPNINSYFAEAYAKYPAIPRGLLEATAYSASRMNNLMPQLPGEGDAVAMPQRFGIFGLIEDGRGYFKNNLLTVCTASGITPQQFKQDVRLQILAVAKFIGQEAASRNLNATSTIESFAGVLEKLSEIPDDGSAINKYAHSLYTYDIYDHLQKGFTTPQLKQLPGNIQFEKIYPAQTLKVLRAPGVQINYKGGRIAAGNNVVPTAGNSNSTSRTDNTTEVAAVQSTDYPPALWDQASTSNYTVGRGGYVPTNVVVHTCEGSYAGTISWFNNSAAQVSAHYVVRSSDGQITQMVLEKDKAWHVLDHNYYTIGIEHEGYVASGNTWYTDAMYNSSAALVRDICTSWTIDGTTCFRGPATSGTNFLPVTVRIKGHQHYSGNTHTDPGIYWNWEKYANLINPPTAATIVSFAVKSQNTGLAIASASVTITKPDGTTTTTTTNSSGKLVLGIDSGKYNFSFSKSNYSTLKTFFTGGPNDSVYADINLDSASSARVATNAIVTAPTASTGNNMLITGYVRDADANLALTGVQVNAGNYTATTNSQGYFAINVPATAVEQGKLPAAITVQTTRAGYITHTIKNFYAIPQTFELQIALTAANNTTAAFAGEEVLIKRHGLFDKTPEEQAIFSAPVAHAPVADVARTAATAATLALPASIRVATSCACTACSNPKVQVMSLEAYVQTGVDDEWVSSWNAASLQAGAVAYRSRGAWFVQNPVASNYDVSAAACHQTWQTDRATSVKNAAIATAGIVLIKNGAIYKAEYCAESNNAGCGDGYSGTGTDYPCISDARCAGRTKSGAGRGMCQWGSSFWGTDQTYTWILNHYYNPDSAAIQTSITATTNNTNDTKTESAGIIKVAPNPVNGSSITVVFTLNDASQPAGIVLTDSYGNVTQQRAVVLQQGSNRITMPVSGLKAGIYTLTIRLSASGKATSKKLVVVK
jgi:N-acetyl-anhydromuramyl-L-alanine amidase AmpD